LKQEPAGKRGLVGSPPAECDEGLTVARATLANLATCWLSVLHVDSAILPYSAQGGKRWTGGTVRYLARVPGVIEYAAEMWRPPIANTCAAAASGPHLSQCHPISDLGLWRQPGMAGVGHMAGHSTKHRRRPNGSSMTGSGLSRVGKRLAHHRGCPRLLVIPGLLRRVMRL
jgi:hypothetical protein